MTTTLYHQAKNVLGTEFARHFFIDAGCVKAKVTLAWMLLAQRDRIAVQCLALELEPSLVEVAERNVLAMFPQGSARIVLGDAVTHNYRNERSPLNFFLQNPFDELTMARLLERLRTTEHLELLANLTLATVALERGYEAVRVNEGYHQLGRSRILVPAHRSS